MIFVVGGLCVLVLALCGVIAVQERRVLELTKRVTFLERLGVAQADATRERHPRIPMRSMIRRRQP